MKYLSDFIIYFLSSICCFIGVEFFIGILEYLSSGVFFINFWFALKISFIVPIMAIFFHVLFDVLFYMIRK